MPRIPLPNLTPKALSTISALVTAGLLLSGCASYSLIPSKELEANREEQQALQDKQQELLAQLEKLTAVRAGLETQLAAERDKRASLQKREKELEQDLDEHGSAMEAIAGLESKWEYWRKQDLKRQLQTRQVDADEDAKLYLLLLEKKAEMARLNEQLETAILEVVRTKAKLRSVESKAEAASNLAEAEIAVESLKERQGKNWDRDPNVIKAEELTKRSAIEFEGGNYSGSLYLTGEAKNVIKNAEARSMNQELSSMMEGEVAFVLPLSLELLGESDIREGPDLHFKVLFSSEKGAPVTGYSYLGQWVRVKNKYGDSGWIFYKQLTYPD